MTSQESEHAYGRLRPEASERLAERWHQLHLRMHTKGNYAEAWKKDTVEPLLKEMSERGELGEVVVDVAAGRSRLVRDLRDKHTVGTIDIVQPDPGSGEHFSIQADLRHLDKPGKQTKKGMLNAAGILRERGLPLRVHTFVLSDALNYMDYQKVLRELDVALAPGGRVVIVNEPGFGAVELMEPGKARLRRNSDLIEFLESKRPAGMGYVVERPTHRDAEYLDTLKERLIIVARKAAA